MRQPSTSLDLVKARDAVRRAKHSLIEAEKQFDEDCGVGFNLPAINRVRAAERRLEEARARLRKIDPNSIE
jgi:hypothetical protein